MDFGTGSQALARQLQEEEDLHAQQVYARRQRERQAQQQQQQGQAPAWAQSASQVPSGELARKKKKDCVIM